jgi:hypothetical protein
MSVFSARCETGYYYSSIELYRREYRSSSVPNRTEVVHGGSVHRNIVKFIIGRLLSHYSLIEHCRLLKYYM